ncbi:MAG: radical SAM family heme chaperone HemW [Bacteroidales bacterium]|nr:radical SAM family heme chaperone HemW [Bacteroidales bacterium]
MDNAFYIHIPYCKQVCYYCDFHFRVAMKDKQAMLKAMQEEIFLRKDYLRLHNDRDSKTMIHTLYFGGGTPSVLTPEDLSLLLDAFRKYYTLSPDAEVTIETNPDDLTPAYLEGLSQLGFNRLSIGIQSFFDDDLRWMNRRHNADEAIQSVNLAQKIGFDNINIDLIYGLPGMDAEKWKENLTRAIALDVPHLSAYHLTIESRTVFGRRKDKGESFGISENDSVAQFEVLLDMLGKAGYEHYEISNFARSGFYSRHNTAYWRQIPYIGIGPSAHSYDGRSRQWNINNNTRYIDLLLDGKGEVWYEREILSPADKYNDYVLTALRTRWGIRLEYVRENFGYDFLNSLLSLAAKYIQTEFIREENSTYTLTTKGKMIADRIASDLFIVT